MGKLQDLTGQKFGELTVLYRGIDHIQPNGNHIVQWWCQCSCGSSPILVKTESLKRGYRKNCGCVKNENIREYKSFDGIKNKNRRNMDEKMIGSKFGKLLVLYRDEDYISKKGVHVKRYCCQCDCGNKITVRGDCLRDGRTRSCGCILSRGEYEICRILLDNHIPFQTQKSFDTCRFEDTDSLAKFDFYVNEEYLIEFDGAQHFEPCNTGWNTEEKCSITHKHDEYKNQWCKEHNIPLIRIPYFMINTFSIKDLCLNTSSFLLK